MPDKQQKSIYDLDRQISDCKDYLSLSESRIMTQHTQSQTPQKQVSRQIENDRSKHLHASSIRTTAKQEDVTEYVKNLKKLQISLQTRQYMIEVEYQKEKINYQNQTKNLKTEVNKAKDKLEQKNKELTNIQSNNKDLKDEIKKLQEKVKQLSSLRSQNVSLKLQNKKYKADNKIIINQLDRLSLQQKKSTENNQKQIRVMKSLYQDNLASIEQRQKDNKNYETMNDLTNKGKLDETVNRNGQLKGLIKKLNEEIDILKCQKDILQQQNKQKSISLENQKQISALSQESNNKLKSIIEKLGEKIKNLQQINITLRNGLSKLQGGEQYLFENEGVHSRYRVGHIYSKR